MAEPNYNFSGLQKKAATPDFNFSGLKPKAANPALDSPQERGFFPPDASLLPKPETSMLDALTLPFKNFASGAKELFVDQGDKPLLPLRDLVAGATDPQKMPLLGATGGFLRGVAGLTESFTTPKNLAIAVATGGVGAIPIIGKVGLPAIEAFFAYEAAKQVPDLWREYQKAPLADKPELMTKIIGSIGIAGLAGTGAAKKTAGLGSELKGLTDVAPEVAATRPTSAGELFTPPAKVTAGRNELAAAAKTAEQVGQEAQAVKTNEELAVAKAKAKESNFLKQPQLQIEAITEELAGKPIADLSPRDKAIFTRKALAEYHKRLSQNAELAAFEQGIDLKSIKPNERGGFYAQARERLGQELIDNRKSIKEPLKADIETLAKDLEGVVGPQPTEESLGTPTVKPKPETVTPRQALQEDWQSKQVQDGDFLREPTPKDVFEQTTGIAFTDNIAKEFNNWRKTKGSEFELGDAEVFANEKRARLPKDRALIEKPKEIKIVDLAPPVETLAKPVDQLAERRRLVAEKRQNLAEERLRLQEQRLEAQKQKAIEQLAKKYKVIGLKKKPTTEASILTRPSEQYAEGQKTVEGLIAKYKDQAIPKSEWAGLAKDELTKQGYPERIVDELTNPRRANLEQAPGYETSRAGRVEKVVEPPPELKPKIDELANAAKPNQIAQADYERGRQEILTELQKDPNLKVYYDSGEGFYKVEVLQKSKLTPEALKAVQEIRRQAALEGGYSLETVGRGHEVAATPESYYEGKPLSGTTLAEKIDDLVNRKKAADATHEAFVKAKNKAYPDLVDRHLTEEGAAPLLGKTTSGEGVEIVTRRNRSAVEPDAPEWVKQIEQAKRAGEKQLGDPYVSIYRVTEKTANKAAGEGFTFLRKNLSEADNARLDAVFANMTKAANELSANPTFNIKIGLEAYKNLAEFGYLTLKASGKALLTKAEWASRMLGELGESVRPFLDDIWKSIQGGWKPGAELEMPKAFAERDPRVVEAKVMLENEPKPLSGWDKFNIIAMSNKLASASSGVRSSIGGNLTMQMLKTPKRLLSAAANKFLAQLAGAPRDRFAEEAAVELYGSLKSLRQGWEEAVAIIKENHEALKDSLFIEQESGRLVKSAEQKGLARPFWYYAQMPIKLQGAIDALFRVPSAYGLVYMQAVRQALKEGRIGEDYVARVEQLQSEIKTGNTELGKKLLAEVKDEAAEMTFQKELGEFGKKVNALRQVPIIKFIVPFMNTSVNLWKQSVRHTPLNLLTPTFIRHIRTAFKKNPELRSIGGLSDDIAAMTTGTAFMLATYGVWKGLLGGDIIGYGPEDQRERQRLLATGWKPYSFKIGDTYISFKGFEPLSTWLTLMADTMEGQAKGNLAGSLDAITQNVLRNFSENPFMTGIVETNDALLGKTNLPEFVAGMALGATMPTFLQQTARVVDPTYRQTPKDASDIEKLAAEYTKRVPFLSKTLPAALDVFGKERTVDSPALRYLAINISKQDRGVVQDELRRLDLGIGFPRDTYKGLELTEPQMQELLVLAGGRMEKALAKMVVSPGYKQLREEEKKSAINYVVNKVREDSKEFLFKHLATKKAPKNRGGQLARPFAR